MKAVTITVEGGVIQHVDAPEGVPVIVLDYDGCEADEGGRLCRRTVWMKRYKVGGLAECLFNTYDEARAVCEYHFRTTGAVLSIEEA